VAIPAERIAETVAFVMDTPEDTAMTEIIIRPNIQLP
jgi:NADP-dependent 3-hydroxy acid dehydrogenase YdfG